jgi:chromosomal replication initiator protein
MFDNELPRNPSSGGYDVGARRGSISLNPRFTFETFMVGRSNRMAYAGATAVAENPARSYNPLFIYGDVGLGKTHMAQAIGHEAVSRGYTVLYTTAEEFGNDLYKALRARAMEEFHNKYRSMDLLIIDDVQYAEGKAIILEEMFHAIDNLHTHNKQIILCSDRHPDSLEGLTDQMRSRLTGGSIADIVLPDMELRTAILRSKPEVEEYHIPLEVVDYVARRVKSNVRELEGAFQNVIALARLQNLPFTLELALAGIGPTLAKLEKLPRHSAQGIIELVSEYYRISKAEIYSQQRDRHIVFPRQVAMYLIRKELVTPLETIGTYLGGRDHSTVLYGYRKIERLIETDQELQNEIHLIRQKIYDD